MKENFQKKNFIILMKFFITSSGSLITPIIQVDKTKINNGKIGNITKSLALSFYKSIVS